MKRNYLLCIGAQKSGTSWLCKQLSISEEIEFTRFKEMHYFDFKFGYSNRLSKRIARQISKSGSLEVGYIQDQIPCDKWYFNQFSNDNRIKADFTPEYALLNKQELLHINEQLGKPKVLFLMRDPRKRALSALKYFYGNRGIDVAGLSINELKKKLAGRMIKVRTDYSGVIKNATGVFGDNFKAVFYEEMMADKTKALEDICQFVGLKPLDIDTECINTIVNKGKSLKLPQEITNYSDELYGSEVELVKNLMGRVPVCWEYE